MVSKLRIIWKQTVDVEGGEAEVGRGPERGKGAQQQRQQQSRKSSSSDLEEALLGKTVGLRAAGGMQGSE